VTRARLIHTSAFRIAALYLALFGISVSGLLGFIYWQSAGFIARQTDQTVAAEITGLAEQYRQLGLGGLIRIVAERSRNQRASLYLLTDPLWQPRAGNIDQWPSAPEEADGWLTFPYERPVGGKMRTHAARARHLALPDGGHLLVGRDIEDRRQMAERLRDSVLWALAITLVLGLAGGVTVSRRLLRRLEAINLASREIMDGDLARRLPEGAGGDELDQLARSFNAMLERIEALVEGMRQVTDNIAHDLRSPLNRLRTRLEVTLASDPGQAGYRVALEETVAETDSLIATFNALLNIAALEAGTGLDAPVEVALDAVVRDVGELYAPLAEDREIALSVAAEPGLTMRGDRHLLSQALGNLLDNALKYTPAGGSIWLAAHRDAAAVAIVVADSGPGIPAEERDRVQQRFVRLEESRNRPGLGLGLSLVRAVAHAHGGALTLDDNAPGLRVELRLPAD